jgi:hypothetical protein
MLTLLPSAPARPSLPAQVEKARFHVAAAAVTLGRASLIALGWTDPLILGDYLSKAGELADIFEGLAQEGFLTLFQDLTAYTLLAIGESMGKVRLSPFRFILSPLTFFCCSSSTTSRSPFKLSSFGCLLRVRLPLSQ